MQPSSAAYTALQDFNNKRTTPDAAISQGQQKYGVSGLQSQLDSLRTLTGNLQTSISNVDPSVTGRTQGSLVTEAQRSAIVNKERQPLLTQFNDTSRTLGDVGHQYDEATGLAGQYSSALLGDQESQYGRLLKQYELAAGAEQTARDEAYRQQALAASRAASAGGAGLSLSPKATSTPADPLKAARYDAQQQKAKLLTGNPQPGAREEVRDYLVSTYGIPKDQADAIIYKDVFPDGWAGGDQKLPAGLTVGNSGSGLTFGPRGAW